MSSSAQQSSRRSSPVLGVLAGIVFIIAGLAAFLHLEIGLSIAIVLIIAGAGVVLVGVAGFRTRGWDIALFVISLIVLASIVSTNYYTPSTTNAVYTYSATRAQVSASKIDLFASAGLGSVDVGFSNSDQAYQVTFGSGAFFGFPFFGPPANDFKLTNQTRNGVLFLNATSSTTSITITLSTSYVANITATTSTGSVSLSRPGGGAAVKIQSVSLTSGTGSVSATLDGKNISGISLKSSTGSVNLNSNYLSPASARVPISISSSTGSVDVNIKIANNAAVAINASSNTGSVSQHLPGFTITQSTNNRLQASAGDVATAPKSFLISMSVSLGSINVNGELVSPQ
ncbi:MAG TPA: hypothetical protein VFF30_19275 [Nitrososphaerales archaeon]|nr:hypothetical protein [Nitrososphaerales archaeon]